MSGCVKAFLTVLHEHNHLGECPFPFSGYCFYFWLMCPIFFGSTQFLQVKKGLIFYYYISLVPSISRGYSRNRHLGGARWAATLNETTHVPKLKIGTSEISPCGVSPEYAEQVLQNCTLNQETQTRHRLQNKPQRRKTMWRAAWFENHCAVHLRCWSTHLNTPTW